MVSVRGNYGGEAILWVGFDDGIGFAWDVCLWWRGWTCGGDGGKGSGPNNPADVEARWNVVGWVGDAVRG